MFDVDYHFEGRATQDFVFPAMPDNDFLIPFVAIRRRADGSVLVTAPAFTGGVGPLGARAGAAAAGAMKDGPVSRAQGRFTIITNGEVLTNNSEDGASPHAVGRQVRWDVGAGSTKIPGGPHSPSVEDVRRSAGCEPRFGLPRCCNTTRGPSCVI